MPRVNTLFEESNDIAWHVRDLEFHRFPRKHNGRGVVIAILDTGVDYTHPALASRYGPIKKKSLTTGLMMTRMVILMMFGDGISMITTMTPWIFSATELIALG